jgi:WD40 repeat protein
MVEVRGVREQLGRLSVEDVAGVSACRPLLHPAREGWAVVAADRYLVAWEWRSSLRRVLQGHSSPVQAAVFSDNGSTLFSTDGVEFIAWSGASWREQVRAVRRIVGVGKQDERRDVWQMCCLGGGRLVATAEGPAKAVGRGTAHGHVMRVWDPSRGFKMLTEYSFKIDEAPPDRPVQLLSLPGTFDAMAVTPWVLVSFRHDSVLDITERNPILVDAGERGSSMMRRWHVQSSRGDEFVGATAGANNSVLVLSAAGELTTVDNLKGLEVKREALGPDGQLPYTSCHLSGTLVCVGALSGGVSVFSLGRTRNLSPLCRLAMDPYAQRNFVGRSTEQKHLADGVTVVPQWGGSAGCRGAGTPLPGVVALAVSDASKACVTLQEDLSVRVIDVSNRRVSAALSAHHGEVVCLAVAGTAFGPTTLVSGALDEVLVLWDVSRRHQGADASAGGGAGGVSSVSDRWGGSVGPRGGIHAIGGNGPHIVSSRTLQAGWQESLSLDPGKSVDLAALVHPSLSFCRKFRRKIADADISGDGKRADGIDGALAAGVGIGRLPGVRGAADEGSMSAVCLAVHPERTMVACGTVAGKLIVLDLPSGTLVHERSAAKTGVMGLSFGPSGRWLVVRSGSGWVAVLDGKCGYRRACVVQDVAGGWAGGGDAAAAGEGYWPKWAHEVVCVGETLCASAGTHLNSSVVHVITRASLRSLAIYRVDAPSAQVDLLHRVELSGMPAHVTAHPSGHYVYILDRDEGRTSEGCARRPGAQDGEEATGRVELLHLMSGRFKGSFPLPRGTRTITIDPSGLFLASVQCVGGVEGQHTTGLRVQADSVGGNLSSVQGVAGQSVVSIWCCMSGDLRAEVGALPADVTELVFLPDCSALVAGVKGGQLLVLGMPRSLRAEAKRVLFGREEGMNGMTLQVVLLRSANLHTYLIPSDEPLLVLHYSFIF